MQNSNGVSGKLGAACDWVVAKAWELLKPEAPEERYF